MASVPGAQALTSGRRLVSRRHAGTCVGQPVGGADDELVPVRRHRRCDDGGARRARRHDALLDGVCERLVRYHGFNEWVEQRGPDPARAEYPAAWQGTLVPDELWGRYDSPGWAGNGSQAAGFQVNPIEAQGAIYYKGFLNYVLGLRAILDPERDGSALLEIVYDAEHTFRYSHRDINAILTEDFADALRGISQGLCCEIHKLWPL